MESNTTSVKEVVREKYGQAALRVTAFGGSLPVAEPARGSMAAASIRLPPIFMMPSRPDKSRKRLSSLRSGARIRPPWPNLQCR